MNPSCMQPMDKLALASMLRRYGLRGVAQCIGHTVERSILHCEPCLLEPDVTINAEDALVICEKLEIATRHVNQAS